MNHDRVIIDCDRGRSFLNHGWSCGCLTGHHSHEAPLLELQRQLPKSQVLLSFFFTPIVSVHSKIASVAIGFLLYHEHSQAKVVVLGGHFHFSSILVGVFLWIPNWRKRKLGCPSCHWYQNLRWLGLREPIPSWRYLFLQFPGCSSFFAQVSSKGRIRHEGQGRGLQEVPLPSPQLLFQHCLPS